MTSILYIQNIQIYFGSCMKIHLRKEYLNRIMRIKLLSTEVCNFLSNVDSILSCCRCRIVILVLSHMYPSLLSTTNYSFILFETYKFHEIMRKQQVTNIKKSNAYNQKSD